MDYSTNDIRYLIAVLASEEAFLKELISESQKRNISLALIKELLQGLIQEGIVGLMSLNRETLEDTAQSQCLEIANNLDQVINKKLQLHLTEIGSIRFNEDSWGISVNRARELIFK